MSEPVTGSVADHQAPRILVVGQPSLEHGEATSGDVLAMRAVGAALHRAALTHQTAWSTVMCPPGGLTLQDAEPSRYTHLVFACGPVTGRAVASLHERFADCTRLAVGVSVVDPADPAAQGFHHVLPRDAPPHGTSAGIRRPDLSVAAPIASGDSSPPVVGVLLTGGQREYGTRRRHETVAQALVDWLTGLDAARLDLDTRLDPRDWRLASTPEQLQSVIERLDLVVTMRMHGLVLALRAGVPVLAVDPVDGGGKVSAQAASLDWPAVLAASEVSGGSLDAWRRWCLAEGRQRAAEHPQRLTAGAMLQRDLAELVALLQNL